MTRPTTLRAAADLATDKPHGLRSRYMGGCRCLKCRMANSNYETARSAARRSGEWNGLVDTAPALEHICKLRRNGVGFKTIAHAASIAPSTMWKIITKKRTKMRAMALKRLLAVTTAARADHALIPANSLWRRINQLLEEGYTKAELAKRMGYKSAALQFRKDFVTVRNDADVARLHRQLLGEAAPGVLTFRRCSNKPGGNSDGQTQRQTQRQTGPKHGASIGRAATIQARIPIGAE